MFAVKGLLAVSVVVVVTACGGGALVNQNSNFQQGDVEFCGVNLTFSSKPNSVSKVKLDQYLDSFGSYIKNNITGLYSENHHLVEVALCLCNAEVSKSLSKWQTPISPSAESINLKKDMIDGIGSSESWDFIDSKSNTKTSYKVVDLSSRSSCQLIQHVISPATSSNNYFPFLTSIAETKSKIVKTLTPKERLIQLDALRKDGLINQTDYDEKKKEILNLL